MGAIHTILGGKVRLYRRPNSSKWQCSASLGAEDWYLKLRDIHRRGEVESGKRFKTVAEKFWKEYPIITAGERSPIYVRLHRERLDRYLIPYFGKKGIKSITSGTIQDYRIWRRENGRNGKPPSRSLMRSGKLWPMLAWSTA